MKSDSYCLSYVSICFNLRNNFLNLLSGVSRLVCVRSVVIRCLKHK